MKIAKRLSVALALLPDPFYRAITDDHGDDEAARLRVLASYLGYSLAEAGRTGRCVVASPPGRGASAWLLPRTPQVDADESRAKAAFMARTLGPVGVRNYHAIIDFMAPRASQCVPGDAWYLSIVGIHPADQGHGIGEALLRPTLREASSHGAVSYLETFVSRNLPFYRRLGFEPVAEILEPVTASAYFIMRRAP